MLIDANGAAKLLPFDKFTIQSRGGQGARVFDEDSRLVGLQSVQRHEDGSVAAEQIKAKRVQDIPTNAVGQTLVTKHWGHYLVLTIRIDPADALNRLTESIKQKVRLDEVRLRPETFVTIVRNCDSSGFSHDDPTALPLYEREYLNLSEAKVGHAAAVKLVAEGLLKL
jgi:hypothetical protein